MESMSKLKILLDQKKISSDEYRRHLRNDTLQILQTEKNFEVLKYLGDGSYGDVISVISPDYKDAVAIKIISPEYTWEGELICWPDLNHQNVLKLLEIINLPYADLFVTPLMYKDMETMLEDENFLNNKNSLDLAKNWLSEILKALDYLQAQKLCHLDLKADNVLIDFDFKAVLCDFSFINNTEDLVERYGVPIPYRPPETCLAFEKNIYVDAVAFEMWCYGILAFNVLTGHFLRKKLRQEMTHWHRDIYPLLFEAMQITYFKYLMSRAFPYSEIDEEFSNGFNFVQYLLRREPKDRPTVKEASNHFFLMTGVNALDKPDDIWIINDKSVWSCCCLQPLPKPKKQHRYHFHTFKYRKSSRRTGTLCRKRRRWTKPSARIEEAGDTDTVAFNFFNNGNSVPNDGKEISLKKDEYVGCSDVNNLTTEVTLFDWSSKNISAAEPKSYSGSSQAFIPTGVDVQMPQSSSQGQNDVKRNSEGDIKNETTLESEYTNAMARCEIAGVTAVFDDHRELNNIKIEVDHNLLSTVSDTPIYQPMETANDSKEMTKTQKICSWFRQKFAALCLRVSSMAHGI